MATSTLLPHAARAEDIVDLTWRDLRPVDDMAVPDVLLDLINHDDLPLSSKQPPSMGVRSD